MAGREVLVGDRGVWTDLMKRLWQWWKRFAQRVGEIQARLLLTLLYFVMVVPLALPLKLLGDPLALKRGRSGSSRWVPREATAVGGKEAGGQS